MIVRSADLETDAAAIMDGAHDFVSRMAYRDFLPDSDEGLTAAVARILTMDFVESTVAEHEGRVVGGIGMIWAPHLWNPDRQAGEVLFWWTARDAPAATALRLLRHMRKRARERDAVVTFRRPVSSPDGVDRVYRRMGLVPVETTYMGMP